MPGKPNATLTRNGVSQPKQISPPDEIYRGVIANREELESAKQAR